MSVTLLQPASEMARRTALEHRPGIMPDIGAEGDSVIFHLAISSVHSAARLVIRCDADGAVWASMPHSINDRKAAHPRLNPPHLQR